MKPLTTIQAIQLILAPVVMITSCALLLNNLSSNYNIITARLQALSREHLDLLQKLTAGDDDFLRERLESVGVQLPELLRHHRVLHHSVLLIYVSVTLFLLCMVALAVSAITGSPWIDPFAFSIFLGGISTLLYGMVMTALDFRNFHCIVQDEVHRTCGFKRRR